MEKHSLITMHCSTSRQHRLGAGLMSMSHNCWHTHSYDSRSATRLAMCRCLLLHAYTQTPCEERKQEAVALLCIVSVKTPLACRRSLRAGPLHRQQGCMLVGSAAFESGIGDSCGRPRTLAIVTGRKHKLRNHRNKSQRHRSKPSCETRRKPQSQQHAAAESGKTKHTEKEANEVNDMNGKMNMNI
jgi:hypothetical protein